MATVVVYIVSYFMEWLHFYSGYSFPTQRLFEKLANTVYPAGETRDRYIIVLFFTLVSSHNYMNQFVMLKGASIDSDLSIS